MDGLERLIRHADTSEKALERHLRRRVMEAGGLCLKYASQTETGYPDRLALLPGGRAVFVELKSKGEKPTRLQQLRIEQLRGMGFDARIVDSKELINAII